MKTLDKNFSYGYNNGLYNQRYGIDDTFHCYYQRATYLPNSFKEECHKVALDISNYARSKKTVPVILLSGGLDSEMVARSFLEIGREFEVITSRFYNDLNQHEISYVEKFSNKNNISIDYFDIDIKNWLMSEEAMQMAEESKCATPEMLPTMKLIKEVARQGKIPVLGNGDLYVSKEINPDWRMGKSLKKYQWTYIEFEYILAWMRYCVVHNIIGSVNFYQQTPEIVLAMAMDSAIQEIVTNNTLGKQSTRSTKYIVYKKNWSDIELRPKHTGGEKIYPLCDFLRKNIFNKKYHLYTTQWKIPFDKFVDMLIPK
jgi:hypothetical protein